MTDKAQAGTNDATLSLERKPRNTASAKQRAHIEHLIENIDKPIELPQASSKQSLLKPPPEIVLNVRGSSAGAGSSDFHTYRELRRKENLRIKLMEAEAANDDIGEEFNRERESLKRQDEERTAKNRAKRQKRNKGKNKGKATESQQPINTGNASNGSGDRSSTASDNYGEVFELEQDAATPPRTIASNGIAPNPSFISMEGFSRKFSGISLGHAEAAGGAGPAPAASAGQSIPNVSAIARPSA
ncbi:PRKR-interacting protein 1 [Coemansia sp. RSA 2052]|nr:PRKR-interacting protein 1 [Coemansia sp. RSA 2052]